LRSLSFGGPKNVKCRSNTLCSGNNLLLTTSLSLCISIASSCPRVYMHCASA
jgi:hypothetical protein